MSSASPLLSMLRIGAFVTGCFYGEFRHMYLVSREAKYVEKKAAYDAAEAAKAAINPINAVAAVTPLNH